MLVVIGHAISTVRTDSALGFGLYAYIYLFHMPAMILLSGMFSKPESSPKAVRSTVQLLVIWISWEAIWALIRFLVEGKTPGGGFLVNPAWTLWFLVSLATMRILLPYFARLRHPLIASVVLALGSGLLPAVGTEFSASRTLAFMPFFVAGWLARDRGWFDGRWFASPTLVTRGLAWGLLAVIAAVFVFWGSLQSDWRIDKWLTWRDDYPWLFAHAAPGDFEPASWAAISGGGILISALLIAVAGGMTLAVLIVVPRRGGRLTVWGSRTLYVYLLHGVVVWFLRSTGAIDYVADLGTVGLLAIIAGAVGLTALLSMKWVTIVFRPVVEPSFNWLLRK